MAIRKSFGGATIVKPGAYSKFQVSNSAGSDLGNNNTLFLIGEASAGAPGDVSGIVEFSASRLQSLVDTFKSGPLVDAAVAAIRPSVSPGVGGAGRILIWKTNSSVQASAVLQQSATNMFNLLGRAYGAGDNAFSVVVAAGSSGDQKLISITELSGTSELLGENPNQTLLSIQYTGDASTATLTIAGATRAALSFDITLAGDQTDGSADFSVALNSVTMKQLVDAINALTGYTATLGVASQSAKQGFELDVVTALDVTSSVNLKRLQLEMLDLINNSTRVIATEALLLGGVPDNVTVPMLGGAQGLSLNSDFSGGMSKSLSEDYNILLPVISRDASDDIADADLGFTDASSTYTIASVLASASAHLSLRGNVKNRREAQGMGGVREAVKATAFATISGLNDFNMQVGIQDIKFVDSTGNLRIGQPHVLMAMLAGIRLGTDVGEPLTHKFIRANALGHVFNATTGLETGDFDQALDVDDAINNGVTIIENRNGGFRIVVDNTTYGIDESFVFNRGSVVEASYFVNKTLRDVAEAIFVGNKTSNGLADSIKSIVRNKLRELNQPDVLIITAGEGAPEGFREDTFVVTVTGNTANVTVEYKPVQSLDFLLFNFTLGDISQIA